MPKPPPSTLGPRGRLALVAVGVVALAGTVATIVGPAQGSEHDAIGRGVAGLGFGFTLTSVILAVLIYGRQGAQSARDTKSLTEQIDRLSNATTRVESLTQVTNRQLSEVLTRLRAAGLPAEARKVRNYAEGHDEATDEGVAEPEARPTEPPSPRVIRDDPPADGGSGQHQFFLDANTYMNLLQWLVVDKPVEDAPGSEASGGAGTALPLELLAAAGVADEDSRRVDIYPGSEVPVRVLARLQQHLESTHEQDSYKVEGGPNNVLPHQLTAYRLKGRGPHAWYVSTPDAPGRGRNADARRARTLWRVPLTGGEVTRID